MTATDFKLSLWVDQSPEEAFRAINNVRGWWSETVEGGTERLHDTFIYRHKDVHYSRQRLIEVIPGKRVVWEVTDSRLSFLHQNKSEWTGTRISFDIMAQENGQTAIHFTHHGLQPGIECYGPCSGGWTYYLQESLLPLIATGQGQPDRKEG